MPNRYTARHRISDAKFRHIMRPLSLNLNAVQIAVVADAVAVGLVAIGRATADVKKQLTNKKTIADMHRFVVGLAREDEQWTK